LGVSRSSLDRHVLPFVETIEIGSGSRLVPIDELERYTAERRQAARARRANRAQPGRPPILPDQLVAEIRTRRDAGASLAQIARDLNAAGAPTAHGGERWWPSTVRSVLDRVSGSRTRKREEEL
jgi:Recombinase